MQTKDEVIYKTFMEITPREKRRKFIKFMTNHKPISKQEIKKQEEIYNSTGDPFKEVKDFHKIFENLVSEEFLLNIWSGFYKRPSKVKYNVMPKPNSRDNKELYVGSGGSGSNKIRWPKKVRGKATWNNFWKLFPATKGFKTEKEMLDHNRLEQKRREEGIENE